MKRHPRNSHLAKALSMFVLSGATGCSLSGPLREDAKAGNFDVGRLPNHWRRLDKEKSGSADLVFENGRSGAFLSVNSVCERYADTSLESLTNQLLVPMQNFEVQESRELTVDGRAALQKDVKGSIDGVAVASRVLVVRKNACIFDFTLHDRAQLAPEDIKDFEQLVAGFHYGN